MAKSPNWTKEEIDLLTEKYPVLGKCKEIQELFPTRSLEGIALKANRLGIRVINNPRIGRTNEEYIKLVEKTNFIPLDIYKGSTEPILHMCRICDNKWLARPQHILKLGSKCPKCSYRDRFLTNDHVTTILLKANISKLTEYKGSLEPLLVQHNTCGYEWWTKYSYIEQGSGCPRCNLGFGYKCKYNLPEIANLYLLKISAKDENFLKIGITCREVSIRIREIKSSIGIGNNPEIENIHTVVGSGKYVLDKEQYILNKYSKYTSEIEFTGYTELLNLMDKDKILKDMYNDSKIVLPHDFA